MTTKTYRWSFVSNALQVAIVLAFFTGMLLAASSSTHSKKKKKKAHKKPVAMAVVKSPARLALVSTSGSKRFVPAVASSSKSFRPVVRPVTRIASGPWTEPTYADSTFGDNVDGEDLEVRRAAVEALGPLNGSVVITDPNTGRILAMVNQKLALSTGFQPCSTIKVPVALAALSEGIIDRSSLMHISGRTKMNLTTALAKSNNRFFANLGIQLGYERVSYYAHLFGLGEKAGLDIPGEHSGAFPKEPPKNGGMGMLTSFGEEISLTPLQLSALMSSIANGGTLYYLQHPRTQGEVAVLIPRVKRRLDIQNYIPEVKPGMQGAVQFGTARRIQAITGDPILGKTGTCSENRTHLGWFGSFNEVGANKLTVVVLLTGGKPSIGPAAAGVAGNVYKHLSDLNYFQTSRPVTPAALVSVQNCCSTQISGQ